MVLYLITTIGAFLILAQPAASTLQIQWFGLELPVSLLSKQALAIILCGAFQVYVSSLISWVMLYFAVARPYIEIAPEGWEFLVARFEANLLYSTLLRPKKLGYTSRLSESLIAGVVYFSNAGVVLGHIVLVVGAIYSAAASAFVAKSTFGMVLGSLALLGVAGAVFGLIAGLFVRLKYKAPIP
jgi:hypothetical protein